MRLRRRNVARALVGALFLAASALPPAAARADEILVFAAASLKNALDEVNAAFAGATGHAVKASYAASSQLARQLEQGAPADAFMSADLEWMDYLAQRDLIRPGTRSNLLGNGLVLVAPAGAGPGPVEIRRGFDLAGLLGADGRLATGQVESVPAGKYGKAALESLGIWPSVSGRLAQSENVRAALALVARGEAPLGIVYRTDAAAEPKVKTVGTFPPASHPPIVYPVALTAGADKAAAREWLAFLRAAPAKAAFEKQGFTVEPTPGA